MRLCVFVFKIYYRKMNKYLRLFVVLIIINISLIPTMAQRNIKTFNDGWRFLREDANASATSYNDSSWEKVSLPHTWNIDAYVKKDYYRGAAWYRKTFSLSDEEKDRKLYLRFEAVNHSAWIYVNGQLAGEHKGGYTSFTLDITPFCQFGKENTIAVKAENTLNNVPTISGDFTIFGGIYRDVWLISTPKQHIDLSDKGSDGVYINTENVSESSASYSIRGSVVNGAPQKTTVKVIHTIKDPRNNAVGKFEQKITLNPNEKKEFRQSATLNQPTLWTPETPHLYTVETTIRDNKTDRLLDEVTSPLGFRWFSFDGEKGFFLNGKPYKLNGICRHQDQQPYGNALTDEAHRRDMQLIKEMGANFIRISHYPQDEAIIEQCDKLGLLVWEEVPVIDIVPESTEFADISENQLREMIRQHYNHPSVIMWGYMNEILLVTQRKYKGEELKQATSRALELAKRLEKVLKEEDKSRPSVMAFHGSDSYNKEGFGDITDIVGWNLYQGWYSDNFVHFDEFMAKQQQQYPNKPKIVSEYGAGSDKRIHSLESQRFDFSIEYQQEYAEHYLSVIAREPYIVGSTYWNFIDFGSAQRDESMPRINNKGLVYADRTPKDVYYLFKAAFRKDVPVLHIASNDWKNRTGISVDGNPVIQPVKVYTNLSEVELFMDGKSLGKKQSLEHKVVWDISFTDGNHYFTAKGIQNGKVIETGIEITFTSVPDKLNETNFKNKELAVNIGSKTFYTSPESNLTWVPDREYSTEGWGYVGGESRSTVTQIMGTEDNPLFQTQRLSPQMYRFDVPEGNYEMELLFADLSGTSATIAHNLGSDSGVTNSDDTFDILLNKIVVEQSVDLKKEVSSFFAVKKRYIVKVGTERKIELELKSHSGKTFINGIKLRKI